MPRTTVLIAAVALLAGALVVTVVPETVSAAGYPTIDGRFSGIGTIEAGEVVELDVTGRGGVPADGVGAVALNVTVTNPSTATFLTVFPTGTIRPTSANLNVDAGDTTPNMAISAVGPDGTVSIFNYSGSVDVVVDVLGWFPAGSDFESVVPRRALDTRSGYPTADGAQSGRGPIGANGSMTLPLAGRLGVPVGAGAVVLNVAATNPTASSFLTLWPSGATRPTAANLNVAPGQTMSNMAIVRLGADGAVAIYNLAGNVDVVVDVLGWFDDAGSSASYVGVTPARIVDTRTGGPTIDGGQSGSGTVGAGGTFAVDVTGRGGVPATGVAAVALNVTVTEPTESSFLTAWPTGSSRPTAANLNWVARQTVPNMVIARVGDGGTVSLFNYAGATHVVVDVLGWFPSNVIGGGGYTGLVPARLMDTRTLPTVPPSTTMTAPGASPTSSSSPAWPTVPPTAPTVPPPDPSDPSLDPFVCRTYEHAVVGQVADSTLTELSGMARGRRDRSVLWVHEDSGARADVTALTFAGATRQTFRLSGVTAKDWEDMDVGPGPQGGVHYLYLGDIGGVRSSVTINRVPEPAVPGASGITQLAGTQQIVADYPDGSHNAEAMAVGADGTIYVITKETTTEVYAIPYPQSTTGAVTMTRVASGTLGPKVDVSGADIRPDGRALIVRGYRNAWTWPIELGEPMATSLARTPCTTNTFRDEIQGEAIGFLGNDGSYMSTGEDTNPFIREYVL